MRSNAPARATLSNSSPCGRACSANCRKAGGRALVRPRRGQRPGGRRRPESGQWRESGRRPEQPVDPEPVTASFADVPASHDGAALIVLRIALDAPLSTSWTGGARRARGHGRRADPRSASRSRRATATRPCATGRWGCGRASSGARPKRAGSSRLGNQYWEITITSINAQDISISLGPTFGCTDNGAMYTEDGREISNVRSPRPRSADARRCWCWRRRGHRCRAASATRRLVSLGKDGGRVNRRPKPSMRWGVAVDRDGHGSP